MSDLNPRKYSPEDIDAMLAKAPDELIEAALSGFKFMNGTLDEGTAPAPCIESAMDLLRENAQTRAGNHTFTDSNSIIEYMGSNLGMALAVLAALVNDSPPPEEDNPLNSN